MNRREALSSLGLLTAGLPTTPLTESYQRKRVLRVAHLTDVHMMPRPKAEAALATCLHQLQSMKDRPAFILNGGDAIMDALSRNKTTVRRQWKVWNRIMEQENGLPIHHCIGNHDVWGYNGSKKDPLYGKAWVVDQLELSNRYYSFDHSGWHFVVLDSTQPTPEGGWYTARLDEPQRDWLENDLRKTDLKKPVLILSHIPILSASVLYNRKVQTNGRREISSGLLHTDSSDLIRLFHKRPNVKVCLSGHTHLLDRVDYNGVTYLNNGALSGDWWDNSTYHHTHAGYALIDLFNDGWVERTYVNC
ncbi:metallophosphoesterase family protein [Larkinella insperata]|uniref:Metallophosphoesterase family protein n=1 Tax=Larkinella insperata TaxID=332158 RepID=A0ABW3QGC8_9BACT|nr:metallophosphoesterase [Larkinella insperata]